jgi:hypothetical protein
VSRCHAPPPSRGERCPRVVLHPLPLAAMREVGYDAHADGWPTVASVDRATGRIAADYVYLRPWWGGRCWPMRGRACRSVRRPTCAAGVTRCGG